MGVEGEGGDAAHLFTDVSADWDGHLDQLGRFSGPEDSTEFLALGRELGGHLGVVLHLIVVEHRIRLCQLQRRVGKWNVGREMDPPSSGEGTTSWLIRKSCVRSFGSVMSVRHRYYAEDKDGR